VLAIRKFLLTDFLIIILLFGFSFLGKAQIIYDAFQLQKDGIGLCPGGQIRIYVNPNPTYVSYSWEIHRPSGWSAIPSSNSPSLSHDEALPYRLKIIDNLGRILYSIELPISIVMPPLAVITPDRNIHQICQGDFIILNANQNTSYFYQWQKDGIILSDDDPTLTIRTPGEYQLFVTDGISACTTPSSKFRLDYISTTILKVDAVPTVCGINSVPLKVKATPEGGEFRGQGIIDKNLGMFDPLIAGTGSHIITYAVASTGGCPEITEQITIVVADPQAIITTNLGRTQFCAGDNVTLNATSGMAKYEWFKDGISIAGGLDNLNIAVSGDYIVKVTDTENCTKKSDPTKIEFFNINSIGFTIPPQICGTDSPPLALIGTPLGGSFTVDNVISTELNYAKLGIGKHKVKYIYTGQLACQNGAVEKEITIDAVPVLNLGPDIYLEKGHSKTLNGFIGSNFFYEWSPSAGLDNPMIANPVANPNQSTEYILKVNSGSGCHVKDTLNIIVYQKIYIPTAFTPNGDGQNDLWELSNINYYPDAEISVFDRWGNLIYYSRGSNYKPFDGTNNGNPLNDGTYFYKINLLPNQKQFQYNGSVTILR
jgi:gliding motility-associated-like protein